MPVKGKPADRCAFCDLTLSADVFEHGRAMRIKGKPYCQGCLESMSMFCCKCDTPLRDQDFETGRAVTLIGRRYCEECLKSVVERKRKKKGLLAQLSTVVLSPEIEKEDPEPAPAPFVPAAAPEVPPARAMVETPLVPMPAGQPAPGEPDPRRMYYRFLPPPEVDLILRPPGLSGLLGGNRVKLWLDVSEGGCRAIIYGSFKRDEYLYFKIVHRTLKESFDVVATVRHAKESKKYPGCMLVGFKFVNPSPFLQTFINSLLKGHPSIEVSQRRNRRRQEKETAASAAEGK